ncbi:type I-F CRISPR-associated endoribonuclease Cas6/Csy4 [Pseudoalteromonas sp. JBTF-M23]|uniref:Type I-F CRISPR-associated endoribonuclease Cas6/Csy4 n=1 Tax=Pseudoalteromonas caenipelagi TaxID=2726988 RepID=A0A849VAQ3_9GAMM|nr:type I-F CRISPR-associated endoribonuclease Cas6/Csy4 [Pseudoalteromonas caenipelagi]NOU50452.1 type I-F CRISPR-associated endoribonuclease Cas6/Csy4 [Pseudoalteromonas caenipelagi]
MNYYLDITLLPDAEANLGFLWHKVYQQIHLLLVEHKVAEQDSVIAVSFPQYGDKQFPLGNKLRLLADSEQQLANLKVTQWLSRLSDYVHIKAIKTVPSNVTEYAYFKRWRFKSPDKLRQEVDARAQTIAAKNGFEVEEVKARLLTSIDNLKQQSKLPFINLRSLSTDSMLSPAERSKFLLFIECQKTTEPTDNKALFTCYGLSRRSAAQQAAVPWFSG